MTPKQNKIKSSVKKQKNKNGVEGQWGQHKHKHKHILTVVICV